MQIGMIGLGRMGANMVRRIARAGHACRVHDRQPDAVQAMVGDGVSGAGSIAELVAGLDRPRAVWVMVPSGAPTESVVEELASHLDAGDVIIDGGNSFYKDDVRRAKALGTKGIEYVDVGTSGGVWGAERGYCLMIGGNVEVVERLGPIFTALAPGVGSIPRTEGRTPGRSTAEEGYLHCGPAGAGHFVKMVHNGIEYGLMQAYAEGFDILTNTGRSSAPEARAYDLDVAEIAEVWRRGSVIGSWLLDLTASALAEEPGLDSYTGYVEDSGEGRWTVDAAVESAVPADVLAASLFARFRSREAHTFGEKVLSAMRKKFGGHVERPA